jgi:prepilin-type N-terminal cleavage/methylation domain-containing protein
MKKNSRGFSLIELLIVVAIILIIAAIAIPNLLRSRIAANQASAVGSLRTINTAQITYASTYNTGYSPDLVSLGPGTGTTPTPSEAGLIDSVLAGGVKSGYSFVYSPGSVVAGRIDTYTLNANPTTPGTTGTNYYFTDQSGVIRQNSTGTASATDSPIAG